MVFTIRDASVSLFWSDYQVSLFDQPVVELVGCVLARGFADVSDSLVLLGTLFLRFEF